VRLRVVSRARFSKWIFSTVVSVFAVCYLTYRRDSVAYVACAFALGWTASVIEGVMAAAVALGVAFFGADTVVGDLV